MKFIEFMKNHYWTKSKYAKIRLGILLSAISGLIVNNSIPNINHTGVTEFAIALWAVWILSVIFDKTSKSKTPNIGDVK